MSPLKVYKASAGSGKTFQLTYEYLKLLFRNPENYKHILAVTFTNKAASEMKSRILDRLYNLSNPSSDSVSGDVALLIADAGLSQEKISKTAKLLLIRILNDYSRFTVGTIDKFFQGVIRAFAREIGLQAGFTLELDRDRILSEAVDRMFLDITEDNEIRSWLLKFAETRIENDKGWNFRNDIINLSKDLFLESYQSMMMDSDVIIDKELLTKYIKQLELIIRDSEERIKEIAGAGLQEISNAGFEVLSFVQKSRGVPAYFENIMGGGKYFLTPGQFKAISDLSKWVPEKDFDTPKADLSQHLLQPKLKEIYEQTRIIKTALSINPYVYTLGILNDLSSKILDITSEKNLFLLNDSSRFLKGLIGDNPTPFIYEKTGNVFNHLMLDEFQDTSVFQWDNFKPLIDHTLSFNNENLIVGDVKQSIYRWRNSDWKILADGVTKSFPGQETTSLSLTENWRSKEKIIQFNNSLFSSIPELVKGILSIEMETPGIDDHFREKWNNLLDIAYHDVIQEIPERSIGSGGFVKGVVLDENDTSFREGILDELPTWIMELQDKGYRAKDIAILVRYNSEGTAVAQKLMDFDRENNAEKKYCFDFVSNESLFLDKNSSVRFILSTLAYLDNSHDMLSTMHAKYFYLLIAGQNSDELHSILNPGKSIKEILPEHFVKSIPMIRRLPLFELTEHIIHAFGLNKLESDLPYIQAFQSIVIEIQREEQGSIHEFLNYWEEFGKRKSLNVSDGQDAIQIMTIHKAKGLQFKAVLIPLCNWELTTDAKRDTILWCNTKDSLFETVPIVPVKYKSDLKDTIFAANYIEEMIMGYVDSMNLLYVALTRAEHALYIGMPVLEEDKKLTKAGHLLMKAAGRAESFGENLVNISEIISETGFELGALSEQGESVDDIPQWPLDAYPIIFRDERLRLNMKSNEYFLKEGSTIDDHINFGNLMHELFGFISTVNDIDPAVEKYRREGILKKEEAEKLKKMITEKISASNVSEWFDGDIIVENERTILVSGSGTYRPDRVIETKEKTIVVDYKFGDLEERKYEKQVSIYMDLLGQMGYTGIEGYIWYVMSDKIVTVN